MAAVSGVLTLHAAYSWRGRGARTGAGGPLPLDSGLG
jgi:hypothetical protein